MHIYSFWQKSFQQILVLFLVSFCIFLGLGSDRLLSQSIPAADDSDWSEMITQTENGWQTQYEDYFQGNFNNKRMNGKEIVKQLTEIQSQTGKNVAVVWMKFATDKLTILLTMPHSKSEGYIIPINQEKLTQLIQSFLAEISQVKKTNQYLDLGKELYDLLLAPIAANLQVNKIDTLILCLGESLRSLPFSALYDGQKFLIETYALTRVPGFNLTEISHNNLDDARVLAMGASEFQEEQPLPGVAVELETIINTPWAGVSVLNQNFTIENLKSLRQKEDFQILHLATHANFQPGNPSHSYIQFTDRKLTLADLKDLELREPPLELLVLSACQTAVGNKQVELGFSGLALQAGVKSALASFWSVSDTGTLALMSEFYQRLKKTLSKSESLQQAQVAMIHKQVYLQSGELINSRGTVGLPDTLQAETPQDLSHPFYWSGFSLIGSPW
jgi:CHAT domain-containing protein